MDRKLPDLNNADLLKTLADIHENAKSLVEAINGALGSIVESALVPVPRSLGLDVNAEEKVIDIYHQLGWKAGPLNNGHKGRCIMFS